MTSVPDSLFSQVGRQFPRLAAKLAGAPDPHQAVRELVDTAIAITGVLLTGATVEEVSEVLRSLDEVAWDLQDLEVRGEATTDLHVDAFRKARAANALLDALSGQDDSAAYEAAHALGGDEGVLLGIIEDLRKKF